jgi:hypothetical protein
MSDKVRVNLTHQELWGRTCTLCGKAIHKQQSNDDVLAQGHDNGCEINVCVSCMASEDVDALIEQRAASFEQTAAHCRQSAAWMRSLIGRLDLPTCAEWKAAQYVIGLSHYDYDSGEDVPHA